MQRRSFIHQFGLGAIALGLGLPQMKLKGGFSLSILHTNDLHGRFHNEQGKLTIFAQRAATLIKQVRDTQPNVLLLDAGDVLNPSTTQGEELNWMKSVGYDALALGNHDIDRGMLDLAQQIKATGIPVLAANYNCSQTPLAQYIQPYQIFEKAGQRIGVLGLGINPQGLIPGLLREGLAHHDPIETANQVAAKLKNEEGCSLVIALSHLGYRYADQQVSDLVLAAQSTHIDLILGGHTHTFLPEPVVVNNREGKPLLVNHAGWGGLLMGRIDLQYSNGAIRVAKGENVALGASELSS
jgi:5'-nucleotidase